MCSAPYLGCQRPGAHCAGRPMGHGIKISKKIIFILRTKKWIENSKLSQSQVHNSKSPLNQYYFCDDHFEAQAFMFHKDKFTAKKSKRLIHTAVPTLFNSSPSLCSSMKGKVIEETPTICKNVKGKSCK